MKTLALLQKIFLAAAIGTILVLLLSGCSACRAYDRSHERDICVTGSYNDTTGDWNGGVTYKIIPLSAK